MNPQPHDFRKPARPAGNLEARVAGWLRGACGLAPDRWMRYLGFRVEAEVRGVEVVPPAEALGRLPEGAIGFQIALGEKLGDGLLVLPRPLALVLTQATLGEPVTELPPDRELTTVEDGLCDFLAENLFLSVLQDTWPGAEPVRLAVRKREPLPRWSRLFVTAESVLQGVARLRGPFGELEWWLLLPVQGLRERLAKGMAPVAEAPAAAREQMEALVGELPIELIVDLGSAEVPLTQLGRLQVGDVVILNQRVREPLAARVAGLHKLRVWPGQVAGRQAVQIESLVEG
jgi:flagellar motor switch protein FliM